MNRKAFTMLELVFAIVVIGILASLAMPRMERDLRQEASDDILSAIRYTQHMALIDDVIVPTRNNWQRSFWSFGTQACSDDFYYEVGADKNMGGNINNLEAALDSANGKILTALNTNTRQANIQAGSSPSIFLGHNYGITAVNYAGGCAGSQYIAFDYLGRPHVGIRGSTSPNMSTLLKSDCTITFTFTDTVVNPNLVITVLQETGYVSIVGQPNL